MDSIANDQFEDGGSIPASSLHFCGGMVGEAENLVKKYHYSKRTPGSVVFIGSFHMAGGLFGDQGEMVAAAFFSSPPTRWSEPVIELTRLVRKDGIRVPLTRLISLSLQHLKRQGYDLIVSFADRTQGHEGYVYRAASWKYHGCRERACDGILIDGAFTPGRTCNALYGTRSPDKLKLILPHKKIEPHFDEGKHLYWKELNKKGLKKAGRLMIDAKPYPSSRQ